MLTAKFLRDRRGNVVPLFGMLMVLMGGAVGAAVDYSRAASARTELQGVLDAVALMLSKEVQSGNKKDLKQKADAYVEAMYNRPETKKLEIDPEYVADGNTFRVTVTGSAIVDTAMARLLGVKKITISTKAVVAWEMRRLELALALDNTGSMSSSSKMQELKKAVKSLLKTLKDSARSPDHIKVAIVPFDTVVNAGANNVDAPWLTLDAGVTKSDWKGCITDRNQPYDVQNSAPTSAATRFLGTNCTNGSNLAQMRALTNDWNALDATVEAMAPNGTTNVTVGLAWAWEALTPSSPLPGASSPKSDLDKVIVLLTDGMNTKNRWTTTPTQIDARTQAACDNVKATNIRVYTIRVIEGNAPLLQACATGSANFYDVKDASQLNSVFAAIGKNLANVRISQ